MAKKTEPMFEGMGLAENKPAPAKKVLVYAVEGTFADGYMCEHAVVDPKGAGDVVLCEPCIAAVDAGAKIEKRKSWPTGKAPSSASSNVTWS